MADADATAPADAGSAAQEDPTSTLLSKGFLVLLAIAAVVGVLVSLAAWCFVELIYRIEGALHPPPERPRVPQRSADLVVASDFGDRRVDRRVRDRALARERWTRSRRGPQGRWRPDRPDDRSRRRSGRPCLDRHGSRDRPRGAADRARWRARRGDGQTGTQGGTFAGAGRGRRDRQLRRAVVRVRLAHHRGGHPPRGGALGKSRLPLVLLPGLLGAGIGSLVSIGMGRHGSQQQRLRARSAGAARLSPSDSRRLRVDDPAGAPRRFRRLSDQDRRAGPTGS